MEEEGEEGWDSWSSRTLQKRVFSRNEVSLEIMR